MKDRVLEIPSDFACEASMAERIEGARRVRVIAEQRQTEITRQLIAVMSDGAGGGPPQ